MAILTDLQRGSLELVNAAAQGGYQIKPSELDDWVEHGGQTHLVRLEDFPLFADTWTYSEAFHWSAHSMSRMLMGMRWLRSTRDGGLTLTPLGKALLRGDQSDDSDSSQVVVLDSDDPVAYPTLLGELSDMGQAVLVDPHLQVNELKDLEKHTSVRRMLVTNSERGSSPKKRASISKYLEQADTPRVQVRMSPGIHDRMILAEDGRVWTLGTSLNSVSRRKSLTVLTPMPALAAEHMSLWIKERWDKATPLIPTEEGNISPKATSESG
ncbi:hypothetical protein [Nesterenkonia alba]|uniref:hypothetical protein n=1 Tax=Nesterenkonia alba TaxID=515814 RepID=UPI0003B6A954|nr:hypothetical protein [Nesterenkonia alba]